MNRTRMTATASLLFTMLVLLRMPSAADAAWLGFRNDLVHVVTVQMYDGNRAGVPYRLYPGEVTWDWVADSCSRRITIADGRQPPTIIARTEASVGKEDALFGIQPVHRDSGGTGVEIRRLWEGKRDSAGQRGKR